MINPNVPLPNNYDDSYQWQIENNNTNQNNNKTTNLVNGVNGLKELLGTKKNISNNKDQNVVDIIDNNDINVENINEFNELYEMIDKQNNENVKMKTNSNSDDLNYISNDYEIIADLIDHNIRNQNEESKELKELKQSKEAKSPPNSKLSCFIPNLYLNNQESSDDIPEVIIRILKNKQRNIELSNNKFTKICGMLRKEILSFSAEGIGASVEESQWANHILEHYKEF